MTILFYVGPVLQVGQGLRGNFVYDGIEVRMCVIIPPQITVFYRLASEFLYCMTKTHVKL